MSKNINEKGFNEESFDGFYKNKNMKFFEFMYNGDWDVLYAKRSWSFYESYPINLLSDKHDFSQNDIEIILKDLQDADLEYLGYYDFVILSNKEEFKMIPLPVFFEGLNWNLKEDGFFNIMQFFKDLFDKELIILEQDGQDTYDYERFLKYKKGDMVEQIDNNTYKILLRDYWHSTNLDEFEDNRELLISNPKIVENIHFNKESYVENIEDSCVEINVEKLWAVIELKSDIKNKYTIAVRNTNNEKFNVNIRNKHFTYEIDKVGDENFYDYIDRSRYILKIDGSEIYEKIRKLESCGFDGKFSLKI